MAPIRRYEQKGRVLSIERNNGITMFCVCFGNVLGVFWRYAGNVLEMFWECFGDAIVRIEVQYQKMQK